MIYILYILQQVLDSTCFSRSFIFLVSHIFLKLFLTNLQVRILISGIGQLKSNIYNYGIVQEWISVTFCTSCSFPSLIRENVGRPWIKKVKQAHHVLFVLKLVVIIFVCLGKLLFKFYTWEYCIFLRLFMKN